MNVFMLRLLIQPAEYEFDTFDSSNRLDDRSHEWHDATVNSTVGPTDWRWTNQLGVA